MVMQNELPPDPREVWRQMQSLNQDMSRLIKLLSPMQTLPQSMEALVKLLTPKKPMGVTNFPEGEPYSVLEYRLDEARTNEEINYPGDNITVSTDGSLAGISVRLENRRNSAIPCIRFNPIHYPLGFTKFYITHSVQANKRVWFFVGRAAGAFAPPELELTSVTAVVSGQSVLTSGEVAHIAGYDYMSGEWRAPYVDASGEIKIAVTVADIVRARISGDVVKVSGEVAKVSGETVIAKVSGEVAKISGETVVVASGAYVQVSGQMIAVASGAFVWISGQQVIAKVSGQVAEISGQVVKVSGETVVVASGAYVQVSGQMIAVASGAFVWISGQQVIAKISGEVTKAQIPTVLRARATLVVGAHSGGVVLLSGDTASATVKSLSVNSGDIYMGGDVVGERPYSGFGYLLTPGEWASQDIDNLNKIRLCAEVSGDLASYYGVQY